MSFSTSLCFLNIQVFPVDAQNIGEVQEASLSTAFVYRPNQRRYERVVNAGMTHTHTHTHTRTHARTHALTPIHIYIHIHIYKKTHSWLFCFHCLFLPPF